MLGIIDYTKVIINRGIHNEDQFQHGGDKIGGQVVGFRLRGTPKPNVAKKGCPVRAAFIDQG